MREAVVVEAVRTTTGRGKAGGAQNGRHPVDLLADVLRELIDRSGIDPALVDDVIAGNVTQAGEQAMNIARNAALAAGFPVSVPGVTVDRQCGSSQQAAHQGAQGIISGAYDIVIAAGVESMSRIPMGTNVAVGGNPFAAEGITARYPDGLVGQGISAELIANKWKIDRGSLDGYAAESHRRAAAAWDAGAFDRELLRADQANGKRDETVRPQTTVEGLAGLKPAYFDAATAERFPEIGWNITAGNSSPLTDGAAGLLIMEKETALRLGLKPRARFHSFAVIGDDPLFMLTAVIPATSKVLAKAELSIEDIDAFEVNEAFASVVLAWQHETGADLAKVNQRGGAIALGHPLGGSGAKLMTTLLHTLEDTGGRYGLQTMCEGGGMANAVIIERLD